MKNLTGKVFGRYTVLKKSEIRNSSNQTYWTCKCSCGKVKEVRGYHLTNGDVKSCGCYGKELRLKVNTLHGESRTQKYKNFHNKTRRANQLKRTPAWSDLNKIKQIYYNCPEGFTVDHIYPLQGKMVSGLHVPENLQYLTGLENSSKGNRFKPVIIEV